MSKSICPNVECPDKSYRTVGLSCPACRTMIVKLGFMETVRTMNAKDDFAKGKEKHGSDETHS
jgi:hypothetical protein